MSAKVKQLVFVVAVCGLVLASLHVPFLICAAVVVLCGSQCEWKLPSLVVF